MADAEQNVLRRNAQNSEMSGDTDSAPPAYPTLVSSVRSLRRSGSTPVVRAPTTPLAMHVQSASMLMSQEPDDLRTPDVSESSEAPDDASTSGSKRFKIFRASRLARAPPLPCDVTDTESDTSSPLQISPPETGRTLGWQQLPSIPEHAECRAPWADVQIPYSKVIYNPDPLGAAPWQIYAVPDAEITNTLRAYLGAAAISDGLDPQYSCVSADTRADYVLSDMIAKAVPCYLLDALVVSITQTDLQRLLAVHQRRGTIVVPGLWSRYRVPAAYRLPATEPTHTYKFKMFRA